MFLFLVMVPLSIQQFKPETWPSSLTPWTPPPSPPYTLSWSLTTTTPSRFWWYGPLTSVPLHFQHHYYASGNYHLHHESLQQFSFLMALPSDYSLQIHFHHDRVIFLWCNSDHFNHLLQNLQWLPCALGIKSQLFILVVKHRVWFLASLFSASHSNFQP